MAPPSRLCRGQYEEALAEAQQAVSTDATDAVMGVTRMGHAALDVLTAALRELAPGSEPETSHGGSQSYRSGDRSRHSALDRSRASGSDVVNVTVAIAEEDAHQVASEVERRARELSRHLSSMKDRLAMREEQLARANGEVAALQQQVQSLRDAEAQRLADSLKVR